MSTADRQEIKAKKKRGILRIAVALAASTAFAIAYTQAPLYTSNQNQYFLHGLAHAGFGFLDSDWLANTADPTPLFSILVEWTYRLNQWEGLFYVYYAILMGIYLFSLIGITKKIYPEISEPEVFFTMVTGVILIHSAGIRLVLSRLIGVNWTYILEDGVADQRLLGSVFQPSTFGVLLLLSIYLFLDRKLVWAVVSAVGAATFHPTYLLSAGLLILTYILWLYREKRGIREPVWIGFLALILVLPILLYVFLNFGNISPEITTSARQILVEFRIPHHAQISWWFDATAVIKLLLIILALFLVKKTSLFWIILVPSSLALGLTAIQILTNSSALAILFPWRVSTWLVPLSAAILLARIVIQAVDFLNRKGVKNFPGLYLANIIIITLAVSAGIVRTCLEFTRQANSPEQDLFAWVSKSKSAGDRYLVPIKMQDFRLVTGVPIFVDFKSIPYRDTDVLEWHRRIRLADKFYDDHDCALLLEFAGQEGISHFISPEADFRVACPETTRVYQDAQYSIFTIAP